MTKKDFVEIARVIFESNVLEDDQVEAFANEMADMLRQQNERFDRGRFIDACVNGMKDFFGYEG